MGEKYKMNNTLYGRDAIDLINEQIGAHSAGIEKALSGFETQSSFFAWLDTFRSIEELINLPFELDDPSLENALVDLQFDEINPGKIQMICNALNTKFGEDFTQRFETTAYQCSASCSAFMISGLVEPATGLQSVKHAIGYFQSRRRHLLAMLYSIPSMCSGKKTMERLDTLNQILPQVEISGRTLTGLHEKKALSNIFPNFSLTVDKFGFSASHVFEPLDRLYLEPERASIMEMVESNSDNMTETQFESVTSQSVFSAAELRNNINLIETAYSEFSLSDSAFAPMAEFTRGCLNHCEDDYLIRLSSDQFDEIASASGLTLSMRRQIVHSGGDYTANTCAIAACIKLGDELVSTVTLLSRFLYYWKSICLNRIKRFQIRSGFIFEESVKQALKNQGFDVTDTKRINRKEFDVVAILDGVIFNVQCKNNMVVLDRVIADPKLFARYNRQLDRYYSRALAKEEEREKLLTDKFGLQKVRHTVVSRFAIATENPRVISYARIEDFRGIVTGVEV